MYLDEFRLRVAQAGLQLPPALICNGDVDATLLRFLRARKWHVEAAFTMLESEWGRALTRQSPKVIAHT